MYGTESSKHRNSWSGKNSLHAQNHASPHLPTYPQILLIQKHKKVKTKIPTACKLAGSDTPRCWYSEKTIHPSEQYFRVLLKSLSPDELQNRMCLSDHSMGAAVTAHPTKVQLLNQPGQPQAPEASTQHRGPRGHICTQLLSCC